MKHTDIFTSSRRARPGLPKTKEATEYMQLVKEVRELDNIRKQQKRHWGDCQMCITCYDCTCKNGGDIDPLLVRCEPCLEEYFELNES